MSEVSNQADLAAKFSLPTVKDLLKSGIQFGHETKRWHPSMNQYIWGEKNGVHIFDITQTHKKLVEAVEALAKLAEQGDVLFVGTKRQAASFIKDHAMKSGSYFIANRWVGGFFTNFPQVRRSLKRLHQLEELFDKGVEGHTKFEISRMKNEWERLNRLYEGVKGMESAPVAVIIVDPKYEAAAVKEANLAGIPVIALTDTNTNPKRVNYLVPGNDDALGSISVFIETVSAVVTKVRAGKGVKHDIKDYSNVEVKIIKSDSAAIEAEPADIVRVPAAQIETATEQVEKPKARKSTGVPKDKDATEEKLEGGILGRSRTKK